MGHPSPLSQRHHSPVTAACHYWHASKHPSPHIPFSGFPTFGPPSPPSPTNTKNIEGAGQVAGTLASESQSAPTCPAVGPAKEDASSLRCPVAHPPPFPKWPQTQKRRGRGRLLALLRGRLRASRRQQPPLSRSASDSRGCLPAGPSTSPLYSCLFVVHSWFEQRPTRATAAYSHVQRPKGQARSAQQSLHRSARICEDLRGNFLLGGNRPLPSNPHPSAFIPHPFPKPFPPPRPLCYFSQVRVSPDPRRPR